MTDSQHEAERTEALDPATTPERLAALMEDHAAAVLGNPSLRLLVVERPDWWSGLRAQALQHVAFSPLCPLEFVAWAFRARRVPWRVCIGLMVNDKLPVEVRRQAFMRRGAVMRIQWLERRNLLEEKILTADELTLLERGGGMYPQIVPDPSMSEAELEQLAQLGSFGRYLVLHHPACTAALKERLRTT